MPAALLADAALGGCVVTRLAARAAFAKHRRSMVTSDLIPELGGVVDALFPVDSGPSSNL